MRIFFQCPGKAEIGQLLHEGVRVKFFGQVDAGSLPGGVQQKFGSQYGRDCCGVADCLGFDFPVAGGMVADIVEIAGFLTAVLNAFEQTADIGPAGVARRQ